MSSNEWEPSHSESESESDSLDSDERIEDDTVIDAAPGSGAQGTVWNPSADDVPSEQSEDDDESASGVHDMADESSSETDAFGDCIKNDELEDLTDDDCIIDEVRTRVPGTPPPPRSEDTARRPQIDAEEWGELEKIMYHRLPYHSSSQLTA
jgi:hypothetical protein